jgi:hypothetical protein
MNMEKGGSFRPEQGNLYETTTSSEPSVVVITCASIVEPFLVPRSHGISSQEVGKLFSTVALIFWFNLLQVCQVPKFATFFAAYRFLSIMIWLCAGILFISIICGGS